MTDAPQTSDLTPYKPSESTKVLLEPLAGTERHHVIPISEWKHPVIEELKLNELRSLFDLSSGDSNGIYLDFHNGSHPELTKHTTDFLDQLAEDDIFKSLKAGTSVDPVGDREWLAGEVKKFTDQTRAMLSDAVMSDFNPDGSIKQGGLGRLLSNASDDGVVLVKEFDANKAASLSPNQLTEYKRSVVALHNEAVYKGLDRSAAQTERIRVAVSLGDENLTRIATDPGMRSQIDNIRAEALAKGIQIDEHFALSKFTQESLTNIAEKSSKYSAGALIRYAAKHPTVFGKVALQKIGSKFVPFANVASTISDFADLGQILWANRDSIKSTFADITGFYTSLYRELSANGSQLPSGAATTSLFSIVDPEMGPVFSLRPGAPSPIGDYVFFYLHGYTDNQSIVNAINILEDSGAIARYSTSFDQIPPELLAIRENAKIILDKMLWDDRFSIYDGSNTRVLNELGRDLFHANYALEASAFVKSLDDLITEEIVVTANRPSILSIEERKFVDGSTSVSVNSTIDLSDTQSPMVARSLAGALAHEGTIESINDATTVEVSDTRTYDAAGEETNRQTEIRVFTKGRPNTKVLSGNIAQMFGTNLSRLLGISDPILSRAASATAGELAKNITQELDDVFAKNSTVGFDDFGSDLQGAALGALSSLMTAELLSGLGVHGLPGEIANIAAGSAIGNIITDR